MCVGIPMQVLKLEPGHAWCQGRGEQRRVNTALLGDVQPGEWLLIFLDAARERIDAERAAEVNAALDLLEAALQHPVSGAPAQARFALPSAMSAHDLAALTGQVPAHTSPRTEPPQ